MKKFVCICLICALLLTAGCGRVPVVPVTEAGTEIPPETEPQQDLLDGSIPAGDFLCLYDQILDGLSRVTGLYAAGNNLLICGSSTTWAESEASEQTDFQLCLLDIGTGALLASAEFMLPDLGQIQILRDGFGITESLSGRVIRLDERLQTRGTYTVPDSSTGLYLSTDGRYAYTVPETGGICRRNLETGTDTLLLSDMHHTFISACHEDDLTMICLGSDDRYHHLHLPMSGGEIEELPINRGMVSAEYADGAWFGPDPGEKSLYFIGSSSDPLCARIPEFSTADSVSGPAPLFLTDFDDDGNTVIDFYTLEGKSFASGILPPELMLMSDPVWSDARQGYFFLAMTREEKYRVLFLKPEPEQNTISVTRLSQRTDVNNPLPEALLRRAEEISRRYGVQIRLGLDCKTQFQNFEARQELDPGIISGALDQLEQAFLSYPAGFLSQLPYGYYSQAEICLMGTLHDRDVPENANGFTSFAAFTGHDTQGLYMVLDVTLTGLEQTLYHEMSHMIDARLDFHASNWDALYSEEAWAALNPPDFQYAESLYDIPSRFYSDDYNGYFTDIYARTYPTEDRARVMEYAMMGGLGCFEGEFYLPLRAKLQFYADAIRDCFDTAGWPEITRWEEPLF